MGKKRSRCSRCRGETVRTAADGLCFACVLADRMARKDAKANRERRAANTGPTMEQLDELIARQFACRPAWFDKEYGCSGHRGPR